MQRDIQKSAKALLLDGGALTAGSFLIPSQAAIGSVSGLVNVLKELVPLPFSVISMALNLALLLLGFLLFGPVFGAKTVYTTIVMPLFLALFEWLFPNWQSMTGSAELDVICHLLIASLGQSILFNRNASSGGLDIVAKIPNKYFHLDLGTSLALCGACVALSSAFVYDSKVVVLSLLGTYCNGKLVDAFIFSQNLKRKVCIITRHEEEVLDYLLKDLDCGATVYTATGAYTGQQFREIAAIVDKSKYQKLMSFMAQTDRDAFVTVYTVSDMRSRPKRIAASR